MVISPTIVPEFITSVPLIKFNNKLENHCVLWQGIMSAGSSGNRKLHEWLFWSKNVQISFKKQCVGDYVFTITRPCS